MKKYAATMLSFCCLLGSIGLISQETKAPNTIRVSLMRIDNVVMGVGMGLTFDKEAVDKALAKTPVMLPEPLPPGAKVGFNYPDDFFVLLERREGSDAVLLTVDANMNRDLRDDAKVEVPRREKAKDGVIILVKRVYPGPPPAEAQLPYRFVYRPEKNDQGETEDYFFLSPAYQRTGMFSFQGRKYAVELNDFNGLGKFDKSNLSRGTVLSVYPMDGRKGPGKQFRGYELIPLGNEFYEVRDGALDGSWIEFARNTLPHASLGRPVPDFELTDTAGKPFRLSDYRGRNLLLDFWPSWCAPCIGEFSNIKKTVEKYADKALAVVGINLDSEKRLDLARKVIADKELPWRQVLEGKGYFLPIYQILGRLPELPMSFPLYVILDPEGIVRFATNDFRKMERYLEHAFSDDPDKGEVIFVPIVPSWTWNESGPLPVDFDSDGLKEALKDPKLKLPAGLPPEARIGRLPNGTMLIARPAPVPGKWMLRVDKERTLDLTDDEDKEIPVLDGFPLNADEGTKFDVIIRFPNGGSFLSFSFFGRKAENGTAGPKIYYIGVQSSGQGSFVRDNESYEVLIYDPSCDGLYTPQDARAVDFLTLRKIEDSRRIPLHKGSSNISIGGQLFRLRHVHEDGRLVELEMKR